MPDYGDLLRFLAQNPPALEAERRVHASLLELLGACLREAPDASLMNDTPVGDAHQPLNDPHFH